ncbi:coenzyme F420-0:L-glutamate ligase [Candidatus Microgenomates bacterium]|nr:coenzyme F420-0:L-glutamate ligase [Candidatus Microgenomates bacterium]
MKVTPIKTHKVTVNDKNIITIIDRYITRLKENSIVAISSKIIAITQGRLVKNTTKENKNKLIEQEADFFLAPTSSRHPFYITIKGNALLASSGIDESNGNGYLILLPVNLQEITNQIREFLKNKFKIRNLGIIVTDSKTSPLRFGVTGLTLTHSGFIGVNDYIGKKDLFGKILKSTRVNVMDGLAAAAVVVTGESREQTPLAIIEDLPFVKFQDRVPSKEELNNLQIDLEDDLYASFLRSVKWQKGKK